MKVVFLGSTEIAIPSLQKLMDSRHEVLAVVCQTDKPSGRGRRIEYSDIKKLALKHNIPVYQFKKIRNEGVEILKNLNPDLLVVVCYPQILSQDIIDIGKKGIINIHPSLLPKYRGPSPIISAILNGETKTGVTIMRIVKEVDAGNILLQEGTDISPTETGGELSVRLADLGSELLMKTIDKIELNEVTETPQNSSKATFTRMFKKEDEKIDFNSTAEEIVNKVRAFNPNPIAYFEYKGEKMNVYEAEVVNISTVDFGAEIPAGSIIKSSAKQGLIIKCRGEAVAIKKIQAPNAKILDIKSFLNGRKFEEGYIIN
jgi:methionyl-tRNA formyltransferase